MTRHFTRERLSATILPFSLLATAEMVGRLLVFLTIPMVTRRFGDSAFGDLGVASQMMVFAVLVGTCGLDVYSVRTVARNPAAFGRWASTVMVMRLSLGAIVYAALMAIAIAVPQYRVVALLVAVFPANVNIYLHRDQLPPFPFSDLAHLIRLPFQGVLIYWAYGQTGPSRPGSIVGPLETRGNPP